MRVRMGGGLSREVPGLYAGGLRLTGATPLRNRSGETASSQRFTDLPTHRAGGFANPARRRVFLFRQCVASHVQAPACAPIRHANDPPRAGRSRSATRVRIWLAGQPGFSRLVQINRDTRHILLRLNNAAEMPPNRKCWKSRPCSCSGEAGELLT